MQDTTSPDDRPSTSSMLSMLSTGPFDERPTDQLRAHLAEITDSGYVVPDWHVRRAAWLRDTLEGAGVELWSHDDHVIAQVAAWDPAVVHVIGAWAQRAAGTTR